MSMIVIGVDVHKHSLTAAAVDETGRLLAERTLRSADDGLLAWASQLDSERVWAVEDCRHVTGALERAAQLERVSRWLVRREQTVLVRIARDLVGRCRSLTRAILELERELAAMTAQIAPALLELPGCGALTAAKLLAEIGPIERFQTDAQLARHGGVAPLEASSGRVRRHRLDRGGNRQLNCALHRIAVTQARVHPAARAYLERKQTEGKSRREAIRCLKRQLARVVFNTLKADPVLTE